MRFLKISSIVVSLVVIAMLVGAATPVDAAPQDTVRVWVGYRSGRAAEVSQALASAKAVFHYDFPELEAYVVTMPASALNGIIRNPHVVAVEGDPVRYPIASEQAPFEAVLEDITDVNGQTIPWGIDAVQARDVWDGDRDGVIDGGAPTGEGIKVCIIDTGYYGGHEDLKDSDLVLGTSQVDDDWSRDGGAHGSHVAGTVSALNNELGVVGVSPGMVDLFIVKIFNDDGLWTSASDLTAAIYSCRDSGADVISMSLGGTRMNRQEERAFDSLYSGGILHVAAAGNEQEDTPGALSYPASYSSVMSVAAVDSAMNVAVFSNQNTAVEIAAPGVGVLSTIPYIETNTLTVDNVDYEPFHIEFSAYGTASGALVDGGLCDISGNWSGKVVLCERGVYSFLEKVEAVQNGGGVAAIVYNNEPGNFLGTLGDGTSSIVGISISQEDGQYLVANKLGAVATVTSTLEKPASGYEAWDGTSMATPHVAGVAALVWSANPAWTNVEIREALSATAVDLGPTGRDVMFGYGLVQALDALVYLGGVEPTPTPTPTETEEPTPTPTETEEPTPTPTETVEPTPSGALSAVFTAPDPSVTYKNKQTIAISADITCDDAPVSGAAVTVTVTGPFRSAVLTGTSGVDGIVSFSYRLNTNSMGAGLYTLDLTATKDGYDPATATMTFMVQ